MSPNSCQYAENYDNTPTNDLMGKNSNNPYYSEKTDGKITPSPLMIKQLIKYALSNQKDSKGRISFWSKTPYNYTLPIGAPTDKEKANAQKTGAVKDDRQKVK